MSGAVDHCRLLLASKLDTHTQCFITFQHCLQSYKCTLVTLIKCGSRLSGSDAIMSWLRLQTTVKFFSHPYWTYIKWCNTFHFQWCPQSYKYTLTLTLLHPQSWVRIWQFWVSVEWKRCHDFMVVAVDHCKLLLTYKLDIYKVITPFNAVCSHISAPLQ